MNDLYAAKILSSLLEQEPYLQERIDKSKAYAKKIISNEFDDEKDLFWWLVFQLSKHYKKPIYEKYFEDRTIDELMFELALIQEDSKPQEERSGSLIRENSEELESLFNDFDDEINDSFSEEEMEFLEDQGRSFMKNGFDSNE